MRTLIYATLGAVIGSDFALVKAAGPYYNLQQAMAWPDKTTEVGSRFTGKGNFSDC
jgi:hypothetical protein